MLYFFRSVGQKVDIFCPRVPVAKYSLLLLCKKNLLFFIFFHNVSRGEFRGERAGRAPPKIRKAYVIQR
jgi:hypothetical protein